MHKIVWRRRFVGDHLPSQVQRAIPDTDKAPISGYLGNTPAEEDDAASVESDL